MDRFVISNVFFLADAHPSHRAVCARNMFVFAPGRVMSSPPTKPSCLIAFAIKLGALKMSYIY